MSYNNQWANHYYPDISIEEELEFYNEILERVLKNPRFYLDNLEELEPVKFRFIHYYYKKE